MKMTDSQFDEYLELCYENLQKKQEILLTEYGLGNFQEYWYDQETSKIQFKNEGKVMLEFSVVFIGSWSSESNTWMWAWANNSMTDQTRAQSSALKEIESITGIGIFTKQCFNCDEAMAHELTAFSVEHLKANGMYISPDGKSHVFMALKHPIS
ncbi:hypothetical protein HZF08_03810 [Paenibacillus sp. CGMCC 1.16610]|uniref:Uncharacterized protein n=1 Tax=Paenibacillus anseongense TaxID=2682845 RepID=A0ABW9UAJ5_9BACL|nr:MULTISPECIES: DUF6882 domain-containing protein [Paenibacillus]MBA2937418.1 hypothetical protein [Paenibacillus sp. CGMCC 1.16610]MVQ36476.1 hypothetical protein [Paenibacillus anseongense]